MLGTSEWASGFSDLFAAVDKKYKIYTRKEGSGRPAPYRPLPKEERIEIEGRMDLQKLADDVVLDRYGPARVVVDEHMDVVEIGGDVGPYLEISPGRANFNLLKMARGPGLSAELHAAVQKAKKESAPVRKERLAVEQGGESRSVNVEVIPLLSKHGRTFLVLFDQASPAPAEPGQADAAEETLSPQKRTARERRFQTTQ